MSKKTLTISIIFIIILALIGGGVVWYLKTQKQGPANPAVTENKPAAQNENEQEQNNGNQLQGQVATSTENIATSTMEQFDMSNWKVCQNKKFGIQFKYPDSWGECKDGGDFLLMKTDYKPYDVYLRVDIEKNNKEYTYSFKERRNGFGYTQIKNGEIFEDACGGPFACNGAILKNNIFGLWWNIESNQPIPKDLGKIWVPEHNITDEMIWNILKTIEIIK
ncbi:hypothetical protein COT99_00700 [Candidatus Falkowbacteria bacterium CG10_big_fil_rev_8_21_14_0_10_43_10]|uniref:Uncharacterized protein n=1 Tax=Candidatus Falkowbacteria bacterium CG10_big_fil_rev_8_21_14_0_10_43_10 TaxID=1974567 RepID=A0A2H0V2X8_9BACT|nr:MAG: hypothetical protein COT99_00700 [Candidatus Falkowbacteria bacterium CG10_big_fil_rev_8_21_14_0_10_43_10]